MCMCMYVYMYVCMCMYVIIHLCINASAYIITSLRILTIYLTVDNSQYCDQIVIILSTYCGNIVHHIRGESRILVKGGLQGGAYIPIYIAMYEL